MGALGASILTGDLNFDDGSPQEEAVLAKDNFNDVWRDLTSSSDVVDVGCGVTMPEDDVTGAGTRIDRVFLRPGDGAEADGEGWRPLPSSIRRLGMDAIADS